MTSEDLMKLVDDMADNASRNPYIVNALNMFKKNLDYPILKNKLEEEGLIVIPNVVTLAYVLEKMTSEMKNNWRFLKVCNDIWSEYDNLKKIIENTLTQGNLFSLAKALSIDQLIKQQLLMLETNNVPKVWNIHHRYDCSKIDFQDANINTLAVNIMEAVLEDERLENINNAETGAVLARCVHTEEHDNRTGSGPCQISSSGNFLECPQPLPLQWANLYSAWNLAFVSHFPDFVF